MGVPGGARPQPLRALGGLRKRLFLSQNMSLRSRRRFVLQQRRSRLALPRAGGPLWCRRFFLENHRASLGKAMG